MTKAADKLQHYMPGPHQYVYILHISNGDGTEVVKRTEKSNPITGLYRP